MAGEARQQAVIVADDLRRRARDEAQGQTRRAAGTLHQWADDLAGLADNAQSDSPARSLAAQAADVGHRAADYLEKQGADGVLSDVQDFARRRPAAFLGGALLAGFAAGRLVKAVAKADTSSGTNQNGAPTSQQTTGLDEPASAALPSAPSPGPVHDPVQAVPPDPPQFPPSLGTAPGGAPGRPGPEV